MYAEGKIIMQKLDEFIRKYYKNQLIRGLLYSTGIVLLFFISLSALEYYAGFSTTIRTILFYLFIASCGYVITRFIAIPLLKLYSFGSVISYAQAAEIIGRHFGNVQDKLLNVLQLQATQGAGASVELLQAGISQKINELKPVPFTAAIDLRENKKHARYAVIPLLLLVGVLMLAPKILSVGTKRLVHHATYYEKEMPFVFSIANRELKAVQQQDFKLDVHISGDQVPAEAFVVINGNEYKLEKEKNGSYFYTFKNVQQDVEFQLSGGGFTSRPYKLTALPRPSLLGFEARLSYPAYLHRADETIQNTGDLLLPQGTKVSWVFNTKNSDNISLHFSDSTLELAPSAQNKFDFSRRFMKSTVYSINTRNLFVASDSVNYSVNVIADAYPEIELREKTDSLHKDVVFFSGNIKDDYGFNRFLFRYKIYHGDSSGAVTEKAQEYAMPLQAGQSAQPFIHFMDMGRYSLSPGDKVEYYFEVWDNDGVNGSKSVKTNVGIFKAPTLEELEKSTDKNNSDIKNELEESLKKTKELQKQIADLNKKVLEKKQLGYEEKKQLDKLLKDQKELQKKLEQAKQENMQNNAEQNKYKQPDESILEKQKELEKLFENMMTPEMKKMFDELQKLMDKMDKNKVQETLEKLKLSDKDIEKELDRTLEQFKQMEIQDKMENVTKKLDELAKKQDDLSKETENKKQDKSQETSDKKQGEDKKQDTGDKKQEAQNKKEDAKAENGKPQSKEQLQQKQDELTKKFDEVKKDIEKMQEMNKSLENQLPMPDTKQQEQKASEQQQNASEQLQKNNKKNAAKSQKEASEQMEQMSEQMQSSLDKMQQQEQGEDLLAMRQIMENLLHVSFAQEELVKEAHKIKINDPRYTKLARDQKQLRDDSRMIEDSLLALSRRNPDVPAQLNREINSIQMNMDKSVTALEERNSGEAQVRGQNAMTSLNNLALMLNESIEKAEAQMKAQMQSKSKGGGSCKKPGSGQGQGQKPSMANMRKMQEQLNKQIEQMKKMLEQQGKEAGGKKPGQKPGQQNGGTNPYGNMPGNSESLAKMAAEQEAIRRSVQEALQKMKKEGNQPGGDLASKMEETETDLVNKTITQETLKRQQEILTKMLESEKAERQQEEDEKRKSNEARQQDYANPALFLEYQKIKEKETELLKTIPPDMTPYYRQKVNRYFNEVGK